MYFNRKSGNSAPLQSENEDCLGKLGENSRAPKKRMVIRSTSNFTLSDFKIPLTEIEDHTGSYGPHFFNYEHGPRIRKKQGAVTYSTDRENEDSKMIRSLGKMNPAGKNTMKSLLFSCKFLLFTVA